MSRLSVRGSGKRPSPIRPNDAVRRFATMEDSADWLHRLRVVGIDLRDPAQVVALADEMAGRVRWTS